MAYQLIINKLVTNLLLTILIYYQLSSFYLTLLLLAFPSVRCLARVCNFDRPLCRLVSVSRFVFPCPTPFPGKQTPPLHASLAHAPPLPLQLNHLTIFFNSLKRLKQNKVALSSYLQSFIQTIVGFNYQLSPNPFVKTTLS